MVQTLKEVLGLFESRRRPQSLTFFMPSVDDSISAGAVS